MVMMRRHVGLVVILSMVSVSFGNIDEPKMLVVVTGTVQAPDEIRTHDIHVGNVTVYHFNSI
jgi:hypothetical protein